MMMFILGMLVMSAIATVAVNLVDNGKNWGVWLCGPIFWAYAIIYLVAYRLIHGENF